MRLDLSLGMGAAAAIVRGLVILAGVADVTGLALALLGTAGVAAGNLVLLLDKRLFALAP
jgi:hypothetical protein